MKLAFIGAGNVGAPLAVRLTERDHEVTLAQTQEGSESITRALARSPKLTARPLLDAVSSAEIVFLATPFQANASILPPLAKALSGKVLVDCTNPVGPGLSHGLESKQSGAAVVQSLAPEARVVKAFGIYGFENLEDPVFPGENRRPTMLFCGEDPRAKEAVAKLISDVGFEPLDVGGLAQALHLEHMTLLWIRMVRVGGHSPHLAWSALRRLSLRHRRKEGRRIRLRAATTCLRHWPHAAPRDSRRASDCATSSSMTSGVASRSGVPGSGKNACEWTRAPRSTSFSAKRIERRRSSGVSPGRPRRKSTSGRKPQATEVRTARSTASTSCPRRVIARTRSEPDCPPIAMVRLEA